MPQEASPKISKSPESLKKIQTLGRLLILNSILVGWMPLSSVQAAPSLEVDHIEQSVIHFKRGTSSTVKPLDTKLHDLKFLGSLNAEPAPYILAAGRPCSGCAVERAVHLFRTDGSKPTHFVFPGRILDLKSRQVVFESRAFFGRCVAGYDEGYVVFQKERIDRKKQLQLSVFLATPGKDHLEEQLFEKRLPSLKATQDRVRQKQCFEIEGRNRMTSTMQVRLTVHRKDDDAEDDNDEDEEDTKKETPGAEAEAPR